MCRDSRIIVVQAACEVIISSALLVTAQNKLEWTSEGILLQTWKDVNNTHHFYKFKFIDVKILSWQFFFFCQTKWQIWCYDWSDRLSIKLMVKSDLISH